MTHATAVEPSASHSLSWGTKTVMLTGGISVAITLSALSPVLPQIDAALAHSPDDSFLVKLLVTVVGLTMVIGAPVTGFLIDRIGAKRVLTVASMLYAIAGTAGLYLNSLHGLLVSRLVLGFAAASIATISMTIINARLDAQGRARWMGGHVAVATLGGLLLSPVAGALGEISWRGPFALYFFGLLLAVVAALGLDDWRPAPRPVARDASSQRLLAWFPVRYAFLAIVIGSITYLPVVYVPFLARETGISSPFLISLIFLADTTLTITMASLFGRFSRHVSSQAAFAFSFTCTGLGMLITAFSSGIVGLFAGMMVFGLGLGWFVPNLMTAAAKHVAVDQQGRTVGLVKAAHYLAAPLCTVLVEPLTRALGPRGAMLTGAVLSMLLLGLFAYQFTLRGARALRTSSQRV